MVNTVIAILLMLSMGLVGCASEPIEGETTPETKPVIEEPVIEEEVVETNAVTDLIDELNDKYPLT